jgi:hypothetical protein
MVGNMSVIKEGDEEEEESSSVSSVGDVKPSRPVRRSESLKDKLSA